MALFPGKVNLARRKVGEVLWIEGYFITQYIGVSDLIRQVIHAVPINEGQDR